VSELAAAASAALVGASKSAQLAHMPTTRDTWGSATRTLQHTRAPKCYAYNTVPRRRHRQDHKSTTRRKKWAHSLRPGDSHCRV
jgi:hypothetical protein